MKTVYTALISGYEELKEPKVITPDWSYKCFTDQEITSPVWEIIKVDVTMEPQRMARYIKLNFHKFIDTEYSLWLDCAFEINVDLNIFWNKYFRSPFTAPNHPIRNCVYREVASCIANRRGDEVEVFNQGQQYKKENIPHFNGIITSGVLFRQNTEGVRKMCEQWWDELSKHSVRDQIAFAKISRGWKHNTFKWDYSSSKELKYIRHYKFRH